MKQSISRQCLGVVALLCSSAGFAAMVNVVPSNADPNVGDSFSVKVSGVGFPVTGGATLGLTFNSTAVSVTGVLLAPGSPFTGGVVAHLPFHSGDQITMLAPLVGTSPSGDFDAFVVNFKRIGPGAADILLVDDGDARDWSDDVGNTIPVTYNQVKMGPEAVAVGVAAADDSATTSRDTPVEIDVLANDKGVVGPATVTVNANPLYGAAVVNGPPETPSAIRITYTPVAGFVGTDSFGYAVATHGGSASATVTITVIQPVIQPQAVTDTATAKNDRPASIPYKTLFLGLAAVAIIVYLWRRGK